VPWRALGLALALPAFALPPPAPPPGTAWITTLDVGQGLAVSVRTATRTLVYDAGPRFGADADSGERVIAPFLRASGVERLDAMIVTHDDNDHAGGAESLAADFEVDAFYSSLAGSHPLLALLPGARGCRRGAAWEWDGVRFALLHPADPRAPRRSANNLSCVLKISAGSRSMLLTGDIERAAEEELLARDALDLRAEALLVPHHGSRSSSSPAFVSAVRPSLALVAAGYRNRFGHPAAEVLRRYEEAGARVVRTDRDGALTVRLSPEGLRAEAERERRRRYWAAGI